jgi:putative DNA-invertase from lambdoid prophage Rac
MDCLGEARQCQAVGLLWGWWKTGVIDKHYLNPARKGLAETPFWIKALAATGAHGVVALRLLAYVRVSEETENPENQKFAIYEWAARTGHQVLEVYEDIGVSGALPPVERPGFRKLLGSLDGADGIVVYALDRLARSLGELVDVFKTIEARGKVIVSVRESWLQQLDPSVRKLIIAILGWAAEMERMLIAERTKLALQRLKTKGVKIGRPPRVTETTVLEAIKYVERGYTLKDAAKILGVGYITLAKHIHSSPTLKARYYEAKARARKR